MGLVTYGLIMIFKALSQCIECITVFPLKGSIEMLGQNQIAQYFRPYTLISILQQFGRDEDLTNVNIMRLLIDNCQ